jgi:hypothetical protein
VPCWGYWGKSRILNEEERREIRQFFPLHSKTYSLGHLIPPSDEKEKALLSGTRRPSLENAYSSQAQISLTFARDKGFRSEAGKSSMGIPVSQSEDAMRREKLSSMSWRSLRDSKDGLASSFKTRQCSRVIPASLHSFKRTGSRTMLEKDKCNPLSI